MDQRYAIYTEQIGRFRVSWLAVDEVIANIEKTMSTVTIPQYIRISLKDLKGKNRLRCVVGNLMLHISYPRKLEPEIYIDADIWSQTIDFGNLLHDLGSALSVLQYTWGDLMAAYNELPSKLKTKVMGPQTILDQLL